MGFLKLFIFLWDIFHPAGSESGSTDLIESGSETLAPTNLYIFQMSWQFESWSREEREISNSSESTIFWAALIGTQAAWTLLAFVSLFRYLTSLMHSGSQCWGSEFISQSYGSGSYPFLIKVLSGLKNACKVKFERTSKKLNF